MRTLSTFVYCFFRFHYFRLNIFRHVGTSARGRKSKYEFGIMRGLPVSRLLRETEFPDAPLPERTTTLLALQNA